MFLKNTAYFYFILLTVVFATACKKVPNYPKEPIIVFSNLRVVSDQTNFIDSVYIAVNFKDGDGDIGNDPAKDKDFFVKVYKKVSGVYTYVDLGIYNYSGSLPLFSKVTGPLDGKITQVVPFEYIVPNALGYEKNDTLRFTIQIKDRAGNLSNIVETPEYILWKNF